MADRVRLEVHPAAPLAIASGAVVLAGLNVVIGLLAVRDDEADLLVAISLGLLIFGGLCIVVAFISALLIRKWRGLQVAGVLVVALVAFVVVLVGHSLVQDANTYVP